MLRDNLAGLIEPMRAARELNPLALFTEQKKSSDDRPQDALKIPAPKGRNLTLTENAASPFHAEPEHPEMRLSQMQDLGGCRAVVRTIADVDRLVATYKKATTKNPKARHEFLHGKDYIAEPKADGYRSYHMIYRYRSKSRKHQPYNGFKIEIQIRSKLQHAWATAVEIVSTFTGQALKSNIGDDSWKRFFKLMGTDMALREGRPPVPDTPIDRALLRRELRDLANRLHVNDVMSGCGTGLKMVENYQKGQKIHSYLMVLDSQKRTTDVTGYAEEDLPRAQEDYLELEKENNEKPWIQSVLVSVDSVATLKRAYPNFYLDSMAFSQAVDQAIGEPNGKKQG